jgi:hypothetical protein
MGVAYFIALDREDPGFDTFVSGKTIARARDEICAITEQLGLKSIDDLTSFGELDEQFDVPEDLRESEEPWFEPAQGIDWVDALRRHIEANPTSVKQPDRLLDELNQYRRVFQDAAKIGAKWHFQMDV